MPGEAYLNLALLKNQSQTGPGAPDGLVMQSVQDMSLEIRWNDASANEAGFYIERNDGPAFSGFVQIAQVGANVTTYQNTGLDPATAYRYRVRAFNQQGNSAYSNIVEITTLQTQSVQGLNDFGTLQDEKDSYTILGWAFTGGDLPTIANGPYTVGGGFNVHTDLEADDLWQNIVMAQRTGVQGYTDLAAAWATYYKNSFFAESVDDVDFGYDHTFGWGLVDWATLVSDSSFLAAANTIADRVQAFWYDPGNSQGWRNGSYSHRGIGRQLWLACKLNRRQWADDIWAGTATLSGLQGSFRWSERTINGVNVGFWAEDPSSFTASYPTATGVITPFSFCVLNNGLSAYYELTGNVEVKRRMILMARFVAMFMLDPLVQHTGHFYICDFPATDQFLATGIWSTDLLDPFYTCTPINILVRGYLLTGDSSLLDRAILHWNRSSRGVAGDSYPYLNRPAEVANEVGHFMNSVMDFTIFYSSNGELPYVSTLFKAITSSNPNLSTPDPPTLLTATDMSSSRIDLTWQDKSNNELGFKIERALGAAAFVQITTVGVNVNNFSDTGLTASTLYRYQVRAYNNNGNSVYSNIAQDTTQAGGSGTIPTPPTDLNVTAIAYNQINLTWTDNSTDETGFRIERCTGAACSGFTTLTTSGPGVQAYSDFNVAANTLYRYRVFAFNAAGDSASPTGIDEDTTPTTIESWTVLPNSSGANSLRTLVLSQPYIASLYGHTPDNYSYPVENILQSWSSGIIFQRSNGEQWLIIKNGGHNSWFWNDVWGYRINGGTPGWQRLRQSYLPYFTISDWDNNITVGMNPYDFTLGTDNNHGIYADGSPGNAHTYDMCGYIPDLDSCWWWSGAHTGGGPRGAPIHYFSMATHNYTYGPDWNAASWNGAPKLGVTDMKPDGKTIFVHRGPLFEYDPATQVVTNLATSTGDEVASYSTGRYVNGKMYTFGPYKAADLRQSEGVFCHIQEAGVQGEIVLSTFGTPPPQYPGPGVVWEPDINQFVLWAAHQDVYFLDPATRTWTARTVPGADPGEPVPGSAGGVYKRFERIGSGQYILMNSLDAVHLLTLDFGGGGPPPSTIQFNNASTIGGADGTTSTGQLSCSGTNRYGVVGIIGDNNLGGSGLDDISTVTWGGAGMTLLRKKTTGFPDTDARMMYLYGIVAPATGTQDIVITTSGSHVHYGVAAAYTGVQQSAQPDSSNDQSSALPTSSSLTTFITTATDNAWVIMLEESIDATNGPPNAGTGSLRRVSQASYGNVSIFDSNGAVSPAGSYSMTTSRSTSPTSRGINHILVSLKPA